MVAQLGYEYTISVKSRTHANTGEFETLCVILVMRILMHRKIYGHSPIAHHISHVRSYANQKVEMTFLGPIDKRAGWNIFVRCLTVRADRSVQGHRLDSYHVHQTACEDKIHRYRPNPRHPHFLTSLTNCRHTLQIAALRS